MPVPRYCPNPECPNHHAPRRRWRVRFGSYHTIAHGLVRRYRCNDCGKTMGDQTESLHYYAKRRLPLRKVADDFCAGAPMREIGRRRGYSPTAVQNALLRIGRQAMAAQVHMLSELHERKAVVFDGLRTFVTSQDYPCDITTTVDREGETILTMTHSIFRRGGRKTEKQSKRTREKYAIWRPKRGSMNRDMSLLVNELWDYLRPAGNQGALIDTDENPLYKSAVAANRVTRHFSAVGLVQHRQTPSTMPRTTLNPLFPVNYVDRLLRHRVKENMRETIAFGRHAVMQMHRAWIFAWDHNLRREHRVKAPERGVHAEQDSVSSEVILRLRGEYFSRRLRVKELSVPTSIRRVWVGEIPTPPVRWKRERQKGSNVRIPKFARRDLPPAHQHSR